MYELLSFFWTQLGGFFLRFCNNLDIRYQPIGQDHSASVGRITTMYSKEQRLEIGRQIYHGEISASQAAIKYDISLWTAKDYARLYRDENGLPPRKPGRSSPKGEPVSIVQTEPRNLEEYEAMSKDELIQELIKSRISEARLKKGYEVKGDGSIILYSSKNTK